MWAVIATMYVGNVMLVALNLPLIGVWVRLLKVPLHFLLSIVLTVTFIVCSQRKLDQCAHRKLDHLAINRSFFISS